MGLFKKEESRIPDVPRLPEFNDMQSSQSLPSLPSKERGLPALPGNFNENLNREMIKSAVNEDSKTLSEDGFIPSLNSGVPQEREIPESPKVLFNQSIANPPMTAMAKQTREMADVPESIFVRIDKFKSAKKELDAIKKDLLEAEAIMNKVNEIKSKEDLEVNDINNSLDSIKKKIEEIDSLVFDKV